MTVFGDAVLVDGDGRVKVGPEVVGAVYCAVAELGWKAETGPVPGVLLQSARSSPRSPGSWAGPRPRCGWG